MQPKAFQQEFHHLFAFESSPGFLCKLSGNDEALLYVCLHVQVIFNVFTREGCTSHEEVDRRLSIGPAGVGGLGWIIVASGFNTVVEQLLIPDE